MNEVFEKILEWRVIDMTIDTDKTLELLHNSPCSFSYNTNPSRYTIEQKELVKFVNFIYNKAIDDFINKINESNQGHWRVARYEHGEAVCETMSYDIGTIKLIAEQLKERTEK